MKRIHFLILMLLLPTGIFAKDYLPVAIRYADGREITGFAELRGKSL